MYSLCQCFGLQDKQLFVTRVDRDSVPWTATIITVLFWYAFSLRQRFGLQDPSSFVVHVHCVNDLDCKTLVVLLCFRCVNALDCKILYIVVLLCVFVASSLWTARPSCCFVRFRCVNALDCKALYSCFVVRFRCVNALELKALPGASNS